jgi:signal recognition particle subunit SRP54
MFENLSSRLQKILRDLKGEGRVSKAHLNASLRQIRIALLEADVHFGVVKSFVSGIREKALGQEVMRSLTPGQQVVKIVNEELTRLLGSEAAELAKGSRRPTVIVLVGLQGSGKTTTTGKLARWLKAKDGRPLMVSTDVRRPAAIHQLSVVGSAIGIEVEDPPTRDPVRRAQMARKRARNMGFDPLLVDTAGRLHVNDELMTELQEIVAGVGAHEILLVADAMTGQDAVRSAKSFGDRLDLSGVVLTKMDGDARGGAALSIRTVTGQPIKFIGTGEDYGAFETFHPERMAGRILGQGDVLRLIEKAQAAVTPQDSRKILEKIQRDEFTLDDFRSQLRQLRKLGPLEQILGMLPQGGLFKGMGQVQVEEKQLDTMEAIINSMTPLERANPRIIKGSRRRRIARGSGRTVSDVNRLLKQYLQTRTMMKRMKRGLLGRSRGRINFPV